MVKRGHGAIVNIASDQALIGKQVSAAYGASKAAIAQLSRSAALDWARHGIRVNCIAPSSINTPGFPRDAAGEAATIERTPLGRMAADSDYNGAVLFLASPASSYMTGATLVVDGGWTAR